MLVEAVVKAPCLESRRSLVLSGSDIQVSKKQNFFFLSSWFYIVGNLRDREVACLASDRQGSNIESCVWSAMSSLSYNNPPSQHPPEVLLAQFSQYVHNGGLKPHSFNFH